MLKKKSITVISSKRQYAYVIERRVTKLFRNDFVVHICHPNPGRNSLLHEIPRECTSKTVCSKDQVRRWYHVGSTRYLEMCVLYPVHRHSIHFIYTEFRHPPWQWLLLLFCCIHCIRRCDINPCIKIRVPIYTALSTNFKLKFHGFPFVTSFIAKGCNISS